MIAGPSPGAATRALRDALQRAASCVTATVVTQQIAGVEGELSLACRLVPLTRTGHLTLTMWHYFAALSDASRGRSDRWQARTTAYSYKVDDVDGREILAYHWHPTGRSPETRPHLHLGAGAGTLRSELQKAHLRTGFVTPTVMLSLLLESFAVRPRRADWAAVLELLDQALALA